MSNIKSEQTSADGPAWDLTKHFERAAATYEDAASAMKPIAHHLLTVGPVALGPSSIVHDNGCGPGIVTGQILQLPASSQPETIYATDYSAPMIKVLNEKKTTIGDGWKRVDARVMDAQDLKGFEDDKFTHSYTNFVIMTVPDANKAASEIYRTLRPGGQAVVTTPKKQGFLQLFQRAQQAVRPGVAVWGGPLPPEWLTSEKLKSVMVAGGFKDDHVEISHTAAWADMRQWKESTGLGSMRDGFSSLITKCWSEDEKKMFGEELTKEVEAAKERVDVYEMSAWVAVARK